jgi:hypothetical protein
MFRINPKILIFMVAKANGNHENSNVDELQLLQRFNIHLGSLSFKPSYFPLTRGEEHM